MCWFSHASDAPGLALLLAPTALSLVVAVILGPLAGGLARVTQHPRPPAPPPPIKDGLALPALVGVAPLPLVTGQAGLAQQRPLPGVRGLHGRPGGRRRQLHQDAPPLIWGT